MTQTHPKRIIIDVREPDEFAAGHVTGAANIPLSILSPDHPLLSETSLDTDIIVYCRSGGRAGRAKTMLQQMGFSSVTNGINAQMVEEQYL